MKKVASIVAAALITCSLTACGNRNAAFRTPGTNQGETNLNIGQGTNNTGVSNAAYRDGIYLGEGNKSSTGKQAAIVTVRGGRITDVVLKTLDAQGKELYTGNTIGGTTIGGTTTGGTHGGGTIGGGTTVGGNVSGGNTVAGTPAGGTASTDLERVRRDLASAIISQQTHNVTIGNVGNEGASVNNWKLAVSRALDSARR